MLFFNIDFLGGRPRFSRVLGLQVGAKSAALLAAPGVLNPIAFMLGLTYCISLLGEAKPSQIRGKNSPKSEVKPPHFGVGRLFLLLGASHALFEYFWHALAVFLAPWNALGFILDGLGKVFDASELDFLMFFRTIAFVWPNKCINCCRRPKLAFALAFRSPMQRGGTCAAHPPPPEGRAGRVRFPSQFFL